MGHMAPWWQQELEEGTAEPPSAWTTLVVGVMSVPFSAVLALLSLFCPVGQWTQVPLLLPQGATSIPMHGAGPGRAELGAHHNQEKKQQDLEGLGCQEFLPSSH